ncbi:GOLPH3/VPS74 family protein [Salinispora oceanensis]|uniref:GOLPH3/VPS74 family protein n=1 Tax=Salinispora oceanensis TaxID=1050199 RepID=UPI0013A57116|nr:GPP34 family phosphoprotein [Salinispora oceanensis]
MAALSLTEELALLALCEDGAFRGPSEYLELGLAAGLLADLSVAEKLDHVQGNVVVRSVEPTSSPLNDAALREVEQDRKPRAPRHWIVRLTKDIQTRVIAKLTRDEQLTRASRKRFSLPPANRYKMTTLGESSLAEARQSLRLAALGTEDIDRRTASLCALVNALGWSSGLVPDLPAQDVDRQFTAMRRSCWPASALSELMSEKRAGPWGPTVAKMVTNLND